VENPLANENMTIWIAKTAQVLVDWSAILVGSGGAQSVSWTLGYCTTDRGATPTPLITSQNTTSITTAHTGNTFSNSGIIPAGAMVVFKTSAVVATVGSFHLTLNYTQAI
jgi:hypothetical protein